MEKVTLTVLFKDNRIKGILSPNNSYPHSKWWDNEMKVEVPKVDWEMEKVTVSNIARYL